MTTPKHSANLQAHTHGSAWVRAVFFVLGCVFLCLGVLGAIVPGMPTTVFILLAGGCWAKSSSRFYGWLLNHKVFGKMIRDWQEKRAMPRFAKYMAWSMMAASSVVLAITLPADKIWIAIVSAVLCLATAIWMLNLPDA